MKLISSQMEHIQLSRGKCNFLYFEKSSKEYRIRQQLKGWLMNKKEEEYPFFLLIDDREVTSKEVEWLELTGGSLEEVAPKLLQQWFKYKIVNDAQHFEDLQELQLALEKFCLKTSFTVGDYELEMLLPEQIIDPFLKICQFELTTEQPKSTLVTAKLLMELWAEMILTNKQKLLIYAYPENDGDDEEVIQFLKLLEERGVTTICFTKSATLFKQFPHAQTFFIKANGSLYAKEELFSQLHAFYGEGCLEQDEMLELAYRDFTEQYILLDEKYKRFLRSSRY